MVKRILISLFLAITMASVTQAQTTAVSAQQFSGGIRLIPQVPPRSPDEGQMYQSEIDHKIRIWDGTAWQVFSQVCQSDEPCSLGTNLTLDTLGVGVATATARLHVAAGTSTLPPIKINVGSYLTAPQAGAFEHVAGKLSFTGSDGFSTVLNPRPLTATVAAKAVATWTSRTSVDKAWRAMAWSPELKLFAAAATNGTTTDVMTSPDGITWTARTTPNTGGWRGMVWAPPLNLFVAVGYLGAGQQAITSPDGITWTARTTPQQTWYSVTWAPELALLVAVGDSGVMTSPDGITWTARTPAFAAQWINVTWSPELRLFAAISIEGVADRVMTSPDGINWTQRTAPIPNNGIATYAWWSMAWSPQLHLFAAVGSGFDLIMTSPDGITWTKLPIVAGTTKYCCPGAVTWAPELGLFVGVAAAVTDPGVNGVVYSADGVTWTYAAAASDNQWQTITWAPELGIFAAVSTTGTGTRVMTSQPIDTRQQYLALYGRAAKQTIVGDVNVAGNFSATSSYRVNNIVYISGTAPTVTSAGSSPSVTASNGTATFRVNVGTGGTATTIVLAMPAATTGWNCDGSNLTAAAANRNPTGVLLQQSSSTTAATLQYQTPVTGVALAFTASDVVKITCTAF